MADSIPALGVTAVFPGDHRQYPAQVEPFVDSQPTATRRWQPTFPDRVPPRRGQPVATHQAFAFAPLPLPVTVDRLGWRPTYPDRLYRRDLPVAAHPFVFTGATSSTVPSTDPRWKPGFPDRLDRQTTPVTTHPAFAFSPLPIPDVTPGLDLLRWQPTYPDRPTRRVLPAALYPTTSLPPTIQTALVTGSRLGGLAVPPRPTLLQYMGMAGPVLFTAAPISPQISWQPRYPDRLPPPILRQQAWSVLDPLPRPNPAAPTFFQPSYPSGFPAPSRHAALYANSTTIPTADASEGRILEWLGYQPSRISSVHLWPALALSFAFDPLPQPGPDDLDWRPIFPDRPHRFTTPAALQPSFSLVTAVTVSLPDPRWKAVYPDWIARRGFPAALQQAFVQNILPIPTTAPTDFKWQVRFPDYLYPRPGLRTSLQLAYAANLEPIPNAPADDFSSFPDFPALLLRSARVLPGGETTPVIHTLSLNPLSWKSNAPDFFSRVHQTPPATTAFPFSTQLVIPTLRGWTPIYPDYLVHQPVPVPGQGLWQIDGATLGNLAPCVHWCQEALTQPGFQLEALTAPGFCENEGLTHPTFISEDLC